MQFSTTANKRLQWKPVAAWAACIVLVIVPAVAERRIGPFSSFDLFYLVPAVIASRSMGRNTGMVFALVCAALSVVVQMLSGHPFREHPWLGIWAATMKFGVWGLAVWLVSDRQRQLQRMESLVLELSAASSEIRQLQGLLPVCAWCKKMRTHQGTWLRLEDYLQETTHTSVTHSICPECAASAEEKVHKMHSAPSGGGSLRRPE